MRFNNFYTPEKAVSVLLPFLGYIFFGIGNIYFFSVAMKTIPTATAFAVWTAMTIVLIKLVDVIFFNQILTFSEIFFTLLIMVGIVGLKFYPSPPDNLGTGQ